MHSYQDFPPNVPLFYADSGLTGAAADRDLMAANPSQQDTSCNQIKCEVFASETDPLLQCELELKSSGEYEVQFTLKERLDNPELGIGDTYICHIVAKVICISANT